MFSPPQFSANINGNTMKVIIKITNIHIAPRKSEYPGGTWHVEGMNVCSLAITFLSRIHIRDFSLTKARNERIVATGMYYYDCKNITNSVLSSRALLEDSNFGDYDSHLYQKICGIHQQKKFHLMYYIHISLYRLVIPPPLIPPIPPVVTSCSKGP